MYRQPSVYQPNVEQPMNEFNLADIQTLMTFHISIIEHQTIVAMLVDSLSY